MQFGTPSPSGIRTSSGDASTSALNGAAWADGDPTLGLLHTCVEAMSLLQAKFVGLEVETQIKLDAAAREIGDMRAALANARTEIDFGAQRLRDSENRIDRMEMSAVESARQHADDIAVARAEAATARLRGETDTMAFEHLMTRLTTIEDGLTVKLQNATQVVAEREAENTQLRSHADAAQLQADRLQSKLRDVEATIADQRSRINCLQSKLATANYAIRMEHMARQFEAPAEPDDRDILDLQPRGKELISAA